MKQSKSKIDFSIFDFDAYQSRIHSPGKWVYIVPVSGVILTKSVNFEFRIKQILLVSREKLPRVRKRLAIPIKISDVKAKQLTGEFFEEAQTYAITWFSDTPDKVRTMCRRRIKDELAILALSELGFGKRRYGAYPAPLGESHSGHLEEFLIEMSDKRTSRGGTLTGKFEDLVMSGLWLDFQKTEFFLRLLKIINGKIKISDGWRNDIERAAILVGQGWCSSNLPQSFLWNCIALETLFKAPGEKFSDEFPKLAEAFLGWTGFWHSNKYAERIKEVNSKRNEFVHQAKSDNIGIEDLLFTDDLVFNLLVNIVQHIDMFDTKEAVIGFAKKVEAEHILGIRPRVRPKTFSYISKNYSQSDLEQI